MFKSDVKYSSHHKAYDVNVDYSWIYSDVSGIDYSAQITVKDVYFSFGI